MQAVQVQRWLSVAAGEIAYGPCGARLVKLFGVDLDYDVAEQKTDDLFALIEPLLETRHYLVGENMTLADVAAYSYISHAPEGGISLQAYPAIGALLERIERYPGFIAMARSPLPEA